MMQPLNVQYEINKEKAVVLKSACAYVQVKLNTGKLNRDI